MKKTLLIVSALMAALCAFAQKGPEWVTTWATAPEFTGQSDMPQTCELTGNALREIIHVSFGGPKLRLQLSNEYSAEPVEIKSIYIADLAADAQGRCDAPGTDYTAIVPRSARYLSFGGKRSVTIEPGKAVFSDALKYNLQPLQRLVVTINYGQTPKNATSHRGSRTTSFIMRGELKPGQKADVIERLDHWYNIASLDVWGEGNACIPAIGNSITDGRGTTTNLQNRWTDVANEEIAKASTTPLTPTALRTGIVNLGIGGNCVLAGGLSEPAVKRFDRDVLGQRGIKAIIIYEGINDIGGSTGHSEQVARDLVNAYRQFADEAHALGVKVIGATIMPFRKCFYTDDSYFFKEAARQTVNEWIRTSDELDGVIDFDALMRDAADPSVLQEALQEDWLHPNAEGYRVMGEYAAKELRRLMGEQRISIQHSGR